jgi:hypothetical protein
VDETTSTTETVTKASAGSVKITVEEYNDLQSRANRPQTVTYNRIEKTAEMQATDLVHIGAFCMGGGGALFVIGAIQFWVGKTKLANL